MGLLGGTPHILLADSSSICPNVVAVTVFLSDVAMMAVRDSKLI